MDYPTIKIADENENIALAEVEDYPTNTDLLGFKQFANSIAKSIISGFNQTIGVYGEWGSGKTSFLQMIETTLREEGKINPIWFNAWKY